MFNNYTPYAIFNSTYILCFKNVLRTPYPQCIKRKCINYLLNAITIYSCSNINKNIVSVSKVSR